MESGEIIAALPPSSLDAERSVLGAVLQDAGAATLAFETLQPAISIPPSTRKFLRRCVPCTSPAAPSTS